MEAIIDQAEKLGLGYCLTEFENLIRTKKIFFDQPSGNALKYSLALEKLPDINVSDIIQYARPEKQIVEKHVVEKYIVEKHIIENHIENTRYGKNESYSFPPPVLNRDIVTVGDKYHINSNEKSRMEKALFDLCPWRKGPFNIFGIEIDSEWKSWIKWNRFIDKISSLKNKRILDIGSSNGYYMFRMAYHDPFMVLGLEPQHTFYYQYLALQKYLKLKNIFCLPATFDELPATGRYFDTIFCMGVLYHRRSPLDMLMKIHDIMAREGELIVENLVISSDDDICLFPESRYAKMRNVFFIPSLKAMESWLKRSGFTNIKCIDISATDSFEQRKTHWIQTESLNDFLDPENNEKTVEGYPAPVRAIFTASAA